MRPDIAKLLAQVTILINASNAVVANQRPAKESRHV